MSINIKQSAFGSGKQGLCPGCESFAAHRTFYRLAQIPTQSCLLTRNPDEAKAHRRGELALSFCAACGLIFNRSFDPKDTEYRPGYEDQQRFSPTFNKFSAELVEHLHNRYSLRDGLVVEVGCGKGDFLLELCAVTEIEGLGIDPAWQENRTLVGDTQRVRFIKERLEPAHITAAGGGSDLRLVCCRHTLEHIANPLEFMRNIRVAMPFGAPLFLEVPDGTRIFEEAAFEDIYYEHCNYFTRASLSRLLVRSGFQIDRVYRVYQSQYLCAEVSPANVDAMCDVGVPDDAEAGLIDRFCAAHAKRHDLWVHRFRKWQEQGIRVAVWGSGSKCVAFLESLPDISCVASIVDINPYRTGFYAPGSTLPIEQPAMLAKHTIDVVVLMNPAYETEVAEMLRQMDVNAELLAL